jgi:16S rRNA (uracil1498-N3)-methyltransferase
LGCDPYGEEFLRAIFDSTLKTASMGEEILIKDDSFHHLVNVVRVKLGEAVKIFNGSGLEVTTETVIIEKKQLKLKVLAVREHGPRPVSIDVLIGTPKKEALEQCLKESVELGVSKIYLAETNFSQKHFITKERQLSLLISSLEQSNNPFLPEIVEIRPEQTPINDYDQIILFDSVNSGAGQLKADLTKILIVIGPEGGFSDTELEWWKSHPQSLTVHLPTAIMRTPTALSCAIGFTLGKLN